MNQLRLTQKKQLERFLDNPEGGSIIVGGRRGSGKTYLINEVLSSRPLYKQSLNIFRKAIYRKTFIQTIHINLPLIIVNPRSNEATQIDISEQYRSLIFRTLAYALLNRLKSREFLDFGLFHYTPGLKHIPLPKRWFMQAGLVRQIKKLNSFVDYTELANSKKDGMGLNLKGNSLSLERTLSGQLDLSDAKLEMVLRSIFESYSKDNEFVIVFDELDKLERPDGNAITIADVAKYLKNLFSDTGIHAIFITSEAQAKEVRNIASGLADNLESTLFRSIVLLTPLDPIEFEALVRKKLQIPEKHERIIHGLGIVTSYSPNELNKFFELHGSLISDIEAVLQQVIGSKYVTDTGLRQYVKHVFEQYSQINSIEFNATLHDILCIASENLMYGRVKYMSLSDVQSVLLTQNDINKQAGLTYESFVEDFSDSLINTKVSSDAHSEFASLPPTLQNIARSALEQLVVILERSAHITMTSVSGSEHTVSVKVNYRKRQVDILSSEQISKVTKLTQEEVSQQAVANKYYLPYQELLPEASYYIWDSEDELGGPFFVDQNEQVQVNLTSLANLKVRWKLLGKRFKSLENPLLTSMSSELKLTEFTTGLSVDDFQAVFSIGAKKFRIMLDFPNDNIKNNKDYFKTILVRTPGNVKPKPKGNKYKTFSTADKWGNLAKVLDDLSNYLRSFV